MQRDAAFSAALVELGRSVRDNTASMYEGMRRRSQERYAAAPDKTAFLRESHEAFISSAFMTFEEWKAGKRVCLTVNK